MRISDWSSDVCSSDLTPADSRCPPLSPAAPRELGSDGRSHRPAGRFEGSRRYGTGQPGKLAQSGGGGHGPLVRGVGRSPARAYPRGDRLHQLGPERQGQARAEDARSEEHTSELQSLMRISYAVFCLKKKNKTNKTLSNHHDITNATQV